MVGLGLLNVWLLRARTDTAYRGGTAHTLREEFSAYGLPGFMFYVVGALKISAGAILLASENAFRVAGEAVQALGGAGYTKDWPVERYMRDSKLMDIGAGTNEIRRMLIGRELIGA